MNSFLSPFLSLLWQNIPYLCVVLHIVVWQFAKRAQITSGSFCKRKLVELCMVQYPRFSCNVDHVLQHHLEK
jgi:hypothetical protein